MKLTLAQIEKDLELARKATPGKANAELFARARTALPEYAEALRKAMEDIGLAISIHMVRCHRKDHKPLRFPLCKDCQADARMEEIAQRYRAYHAKEPHA